jgi:putative membrane protein
MSSLFSSRRRLALGIAGLLSVAAVASAAPRWRGQAVATNNLIRGFAAQPLAADTLRPLERSFLEKAAETSREEMQLARLALSQAANSDLRTFAQQLAVDQRSIGDALEGLRRKRGAVVDPAPAASEVVSEASQKLATKTGAEFDREFVRLMSEARTATIALFEQAAADIKDPDVRELAAENLPTLRAHQNRLLELKAALE